MTLSFNDKEAYAIAQALRLAAETYESAAQAASQAAPNYGRLAMQFAHQVDVANAMAARFDPEDDEVVGEHGDVL